MNSKASQTIFKVIVLAFIFLTTLLSTSAYTPWNQAKVLIQASIGGKPDYSQETIKGDTLWFPKKDADLIKTIKQINNQSIGKEKGVFIAPSSPGLYAILEKKSPTKDTYFLFLENPENQNKIIEQIEQIDWAIVRPDDAIDGRDELRFRNAYSLVWQYLTENFKVVNDDRLSPGTQLMRRYTKSQF